MTLKQLERHLNRFIDCIIMSECSRNLITKLHIIVVEFCKNKNLMSIFIVLVYKYRSYNRTIMKLLDIYRKYQNINLKKNNNI